MKFACIPAYNEEDTISDLVKSAKKFVDKVIVCDDGSTDDTLNNAKLAGAEVISHKKKSRVWRCNYISV
jgi:glycosyltransferase involved in cell wall biosynthesis